MRADLPSFGKHGQLWLAVLHKAVEDASTPLRPLVGELDGQAYEREARFWMDSLHGGVGSLVWICVIFGLDPEDVRGEVKRRQDPGAAPRRAGKAARAPVVKPTGVYYGNQFDQATTARAVSRRARPTQLATPAERGHILPDVRNAETDSLDTREDLI